MSAPEELVGQTLLGELRAVRLLGRGGMGAVDEVEHPTSGGVLLVASGVGLGVALDWYGTGISPPFPYVQACERAQQDAARHRGSVGPTTMRTRSARTRRLASLAAGRSVGRDHP